VKRSVLTDGRGVPIAVAIGGANAHDQSLAEETLGGIPLRRPKSAGRARQHLCLDKGYVGKRIEQLAAKRGYELHVPPRGQPKTKLSRQKKAHRWVVERGHSWTNRARRLLVRWEKKVENYLAFVHLQFAYTALQVAGLLG
jgi:transposase